GLTGTFSVKAASTSFAATDGVLARSLSVQGLFGAMLHQLLSAEALQASEGVGFLLLFLRFLRDLFLRHGCTVLESRPNVNLPCRRPIRCEPRFRRMARNSCCIFPSVC